MSYDPQRRAPRPSAGGGDGPDSGRGDDEPAPVDALLDGASTSGTEVTTASTGSTVRSEPPPFSVVPEPTTPDQDFWKLGVLGAVAAVIGLVGAWQARRAWRRRRSPKFGGKPT